MLDILDVWNKIAGTVPEAETNLKLIVERRNKITHESDINPINSLGEKWPINLEMVQSVFNEVDNIVRSLDSLIMDELNSQGIMC